jgi:hypothetical protein
MIFCIASAIFKQHLTLSKLFFLFILDPSLLLSSESSFKAVNNNTFWLNSDLHMLQFVPNSEIFQILKNCGIVLQQQ